MARQRGQKAARLGVVGSGLGTTEGMGKCIQGKSFVTVIDPVSGYEFCRTGAGEQGRQSDYQ